MNKPFIFILLCTALIKPLLSQEVYIELSIRHESMYNELLDRKTNVPFLDITYRNESNDDIYLNAVCPDTKYPRFTSLTMVHFNQNDYKDSCYLKNRAFNHCNYSSNFIIEIGEFWYAYVEKVDDEVELHTINDDFYFIYEWKTQQDEKTNDISTISTQNRIPDLDIVFLKAGESYTKSFNLDAFCINQGGMFIFRIQPSYKPNYFTKHIWNNSDNCYTKACLLLPEKIGIYHRCDSVIQLNEIKLDFKKTKQ